MLFQKKMKRRKDYSNTNVKTRNLLTNVSYRRFKQSDFNKNNFFIDILSFLVQNFNQINLERKLDIEKVRDMVNFFGTNVFCMILFVTCTSKIIILR